MSRADHEEQIHVQAVDAQAVGMSVMAQHSCKFDEYGGKTVTRLVSTRCRAIFLCTTEGCVSKPHVGCLNEMHQRAPAMFHDKRATLYELYDDKAGFYQSLPPVLHHVHS